VFHKRMVFYRIVRTLIVRWPH